MRLPELFAAVRRQLHDPDIGYDELLDYANEALMEASRRVYLPELEAEAVLSVAAGATRLPLPGDYQRGLFAATDADGHHLTVLDAHRDIERLRRSCLSPGAARAVAALGDDLLVWPAPQVATILRLGYYRKPGTLEQTGGEVTFTGAGRSLVAASALFGRFHAGDVFTVNSPANAGSLTVVSSTATACVVAEDVTDEGPVFCNVAATRIEGIPFELRRDVLVNGVLARAFETKEDARDGKANADRFRQLAELGLRELRRIIDGSGYRAGVAGPGDVRPRSLG